MSVRRVSVLLPFSPHRPEQVDTYARLVQSTSAARLWQGQGLLFEPHQAFVHSAAVSARVPTGLGVTLIPLRHPYEAALQARSLAIATGHPVVAGFGLGAKELQAMMLGRPYAHPLLAVREYLTIVRALLDGEFVDTDGTEFSCHARLLPSPSPRVEVGAGVLRPRMAEVAGAVADVAITWLTPATYIEDVLVPALERGARSAGRERPRIAAIVPVALHAAGRSAADLVVAGSGPHLRAAHYRDMLGRAGIDLSDDPAAAVLSGGAFLYGSENELAARLERFFLAGADELVLNAGGVWNALGPEATLADVTSILAVTEPLVAAGAG